MFTVDLGTGPIECKANLRALVAYEQRFGADMVHDLFGVVRPMGDGEDDGSVDFTAFPWTKAVKALWACCKGARQGTPDVDEWLDRFDDSDVDLFELSATIVPEIRKGLFRPRAAAS